ncbi:MAG: HRDC domain-containing protein [Saprospiraceae bacterium]|nr:HRDC domain-containing protein [Saprospiraceae bacterium]
MWEYASANECRTNVVLNYFGEFRSEPCGHCDNCLNPPKSKDSTILAQKALSALVRCKESIAMNLLIDVLRGSYRAKIRETGLDKIKTFGAGKDISFINWKIYITQLINQGLIRIDYSDGFKLKTTPLSDSVLYGGKRVSLVDVTISDFEIEKPKPKQKKLILENELLQKLKEWRSELSRQKQVPAYVIFSDKVFEHIVESKPLTNEDLLKVEGIGKVKSEQYGSALLAIIQGYISSQNHIKNIKGQTYLETLILLGNGLNPSEISLKRGISEQTVYSHIAYLFTKGENVDIKKYINQTDVNQVEEAWLKANKEMSLSAIAENMMSPMEYHKIRLSLAVILKKLQAN